MKRILKKILPVKLREYLYQKLNRKADISWGTHLPALIRLMQVTKGGVLELGTGIYSTPFLHWACFNDKRTLVSYESIPKYYKLNRAYESENHRVHFVNNWESVDIEKPWDIVFIDQHPAQARKEAARRVATYATYVVIHDSQEGADRVYRYSSIYPLFKYRYSFGLRPDVTILSNFDETLGGFVQGTDN